MRISSKDWKNYIEKLSKLNNTAGEKMSDYVARHGFDDPKIIDYAYGLVTKYGEGSASLSAMMYDAIAEMEGKILPSAEVAETPEYGEVAKAINGVRKHSQNPTSYGNVVNRLVKRTGADTMLQNAERDGAEFAWIPSGDTCAFCIALASRGWQHISKKSLKNGHAEHIHANCDCNYTVRFDGRTSVAGYDPDEYLEIYENAEGNTPEEKINSIRAKYRAENRDKINAQKRANYSENKNLSAAAGTLPQKMKKYVPDHETRMKIIEEGIKKEKPIFCKTDEDLYKLAYKLPEEKGYYTVVCHGDAYNVEFEGIKIDPDTLCAIIAQRKDYKKGTDIRLISCYSNYKEDGVANFVSQKLKVNVLAPDLLGIISQHLDGSFEVYAGSDLGKHDGSMDVVKFKKGE